jgi:ribonuclease HI
VVIGSGGDMTNNIAEFSGLKGAAEWVATNVSEKEEVLVHGDSQLVVRQMLGEFGIKSDTSRKFVPKIRELFRGRKVRYKWIPREQNQEADCLCRVAYLQVKGEMDGRN